MAQIPASTTSDAYPEDPWAKVPIDEIPPVTMTQECKQFLQETTQLFTQEFVDNVLEQRFLCTSLEDVLFVALQYTLENYMHTFGEATYLQYGKGFRHLRILAMMADTVGRDFIFTIENYSDWSMPLRITRVMSIKIILMEEQDARKVVFQAHQSLQGSEEPPQVVETTVPPDLGYPEMGKSSTPLLRSTVFGGGGMLRHQNPGT